MEFLITVGTGSLLSIFNMAKIIIPLMIFIEIAKKYKILDKIGNLFKPLTNLFNMNEKSGLLLVIGLVFGLAYGAGAIIQHTEEEQIPKKDLILIMSFLSLCHAVPEDTLLFVEIGAKWYYLLGTRIFAAIIFTFFLSRTSKFKNDLQVEIE